MMTIRKAEEDELPELLRIYKCARTYMKEHGNAEQWGASYPQDVLLREDIRKGWLYVCVGSDGRPHAVFAFILGEDPSYRFIEDGCWPDNEPYGTLHRIASDGVLKGVFSSVIGYCLSVIPNIRADTHADNHTMLHLFAKYHFVRCGIIHEETERIAFQLKAVASPRTN